MPSVARKKTRKPEKIRSKVLQSEPAALPSPNPTHLLRCRLGLIAATILCLAPFLGKPFNIDDPLFVWTAKQVVSHPQDPYGFPVVWYYTADPMSTVTKNPPLASYYAVLFGSWSKWSEIALHFGFLLPAVVVVLATYELARELSVRPLLAAGLTLAAPAFLVSATSVMCDVSMLALWMVATMFWHKGMRSGRHAYLAIASVTLAACALTKYFGACLIPLLFAYSLFRQRRLGYWALYFLFPVAALVGYQLWTKDLYGAGLLLDAAQYANMVRTGDTPVAAGLLIGLSFTGGCVLPALLMVPWLFEKVWIATGLAIAIPGAMVLSWDVFGIFKHMPHTTGIFLTVWLFIAGGIFALALATRDFWQRRDADSMLLCAWVLGTFLFAAAVNWTVNARSVLPLIPAISILISRNLKNTEDNMGPRWIIGVPVAASLAISLWLTSADASMAYSARRAARMVYSRAAEEGRKTLFSGHWGFQYYLEEFGLRPIDVSSAESREAELIAQPENNTNTFVFAPESIASTEPFEIDVNLGISLFCRELGAGFYSSGTFGPLPFAFGRVPPERYTLYHLRMVPARQ